MTQLAADSTIVQLVELRNNLGEKINEVTYTNNRLTITRNGKPVAALISAEDLELLEELELIRDSQDFDKAVTEDTGYRISLEDFKAKNGLA